MGEIGGVGPGFEIGGSEDADYEVLGVGDYHGPIVSVFDDFWVSKLGGWRIQGEDWVIGVLDESVAAVEGIRNFLDLLILSVQSVNCYNAVCLVRKESRCVVDIDDGASTEDLTILCGKNGDLLILPGVEIF